VQLSRRDNVRMIIGRNSFRKKYWKPEDYQHGYGLGKLAQTKKIGKA